MNQLVMVIDDSLVIRKIVETCLRRAGYEVKSFPDGVEALCWLNTTEARIPDLVIVDPGLPKLDGYQVMQQIKARPALEHTRLVIPRGAMGCWINSRGGWPERIPISPSRLRRESCSRLSRPTSSPLPVDVLTSEQQRCLTGKKHSAQQEEGYEGKETDRL
jgi:hypothetical protein